MSGRRPSVRALGRDGVCTREGRVPEPPTADVRERMRSVRQKDTRAERCLRSALYRRGLRYRVDIPLLPNMSRRADVAFPREKVAVFVDGCFWHGCPVHGSIPKRNSEWWRAKLSMNKARDADTDARLRALGWVVFRFWEHDDPERAAELVATTVRYRKYRR